MSKFTLEKLKELRDKVDGAVGGGGSLGSSPPDNNSLLDQPSSLPPNLGSSLSVDEASSELSLLSGQQSVQPDHPDDHSPEQPEQQPEVVLGQDQDGLMQETGGGPSVKEVLDRSDVSPIKERLFGTFAKFAPETGAAASISQTPATPENTWIRQAKGRLAKTVEKYAELKADRLRSSKGALEQASSLDLDQQESGSDVRIPHSHSDMTLHSQTSKEAEKERPHSQIFDFDPADWNSSRGGSPDLTVTAEGHMDTWPSADVPAANTSAGADGNASEDGVSGVGTTSSDTPTVGETPTKTRKRFGIPFLERSGSTRTPEGSVDSPRRSFRSIMRSYVSKPSAEVGGGSPSSGSPHHHQDPFSDTDINTIQQEDKKLEEVAEVSVDEDGVEALEGEQPPHSRDQSPDKEVGPEPDLLAGPGLTAPVSSTTVHMVPTAEFINPVVILILAIVNFTGLFPSWLSGFISGLMVTLIVVVWALLKLYPAVSYASSTATSPSARKGSLPMPTSITVHEPPLPVTAWMNLLPSKWQPYNVDTYEVKNTTSVRVTIEHHILKIEYPDKNLPKRLNADEVEPPDLKFLFHTDHVDLSTARISLLPDGIAGKRMFSKKYPIEIRPNVAQDLEVGGEKKEKAREEEEEFRSVDSNPESLKDETEKDIDDLEDDDLADLSSEHPASTDQKVFYLFARADREKEDIFKALVDGQHFQADTLLDLIRGGGAAGKHVEPPSETERETAQQRKQSFNDYMSKMMDPVSPGGSPTSPGDSAAGAPVNLPSEPSVDWCIHFFNVYLHRIFYDIHRSQEIKTSLKTRIYNKLLKVKITQWFKQISVTEVNLGSNLPIIKWVSRPTQNERGLWVHLGIEYGGVASATIETCGFNLGEDQVDVGSGGVQLKALLEEDPQALPLRPATPPERKISSRIEAATNSDEEDSAESDSEESGDLANQVASVESPVHRTRWWEMVGQSDLVKTGINRLSNSEWWKAKTSKKMTLQLEVVSLKGVIVLNIPPPPSDRIWYGFKNKPDLDLRILPYYGEAKLGEDNSLFSTAVNKGIHVLVNRLKDEIDKFIMLPNMDDIPVRMMSSVSTVNNPSSP